MKRIAVYLLSGALVVGPGTGTLRAAPQDEQESKAEKERRKKEEKALQKDLKEDKKDRELLEEIQDEFNELARGLLQARYEDRFLQDYVNEVGQSLVPKETRSGMTFAFRVIHDPVPNAYALPDGRVYVNTGLLCFVRSEAELAVALGHEIGHVLEKHQIEAIKEARSLKKRLLPSIFGAVAGAAVGAIIKGKEGAATGAAIGAVGGLGYSFIAMNGYKRKQEDEADAIGTRLALGRRYDAAEGVTLFQRLADTFGDEDSFSNVIWGNHSRNVDRVAHVRALLDGEMSATYNQLRSAGNLQLGSGQLQLFMSRMYRDVAIVYMDEYDRFDVAKSLLESIIDYRGRDPKTLWALGRVYKLVGRTPEEKAKALELLQRAALTDERIMYPFIHRDLGLMQARLATGPSGMAPAIESLKKYVLFHTQRYRSYPPDLEEMYDYLLTFGDSKWTAPKVEGAIIQAASPTLSTGGPSEGIRKALRPTPKKPGAKPEGQ